jgi:uncharacterized membrane protein
VGVGVGVCYGMYLWCCVLLFLFLSFLFQNMAGRHKIDLMISEEEEENTKVRNGDVISIFRNAARVFVHVRQCTATTGSLASLLRSVV